MDDKKVHVAQDHCVPAKALAKRKASHRMGMTTWLALARCKWGSSRAVADRPHAPSCGG
jgi:hypothetical protein